MVSVEQLGPGEKLGLKYLGHHCFFSENYYYDNEIIVLIDDVCSRIGPLILKAPIMTAADGIRKYFFTVFQRK